MALVESVCHEVTWLASSSSISARKIAAGETRLRPPGWPLPAHVPVFVLNSTSGRNASAAAGLEGEFRALHAVVKRLEAAARANESSTGCEGAAAAQEHG